MRKRCTGEKSKALISEAELYKVLPDSQQAILDILSDGKKHTTASLIVRLHMTSAPQQLYKLRRRLREAGLADIHSERAGEKARQDRYWLVWRDKQIVMGF